MSETTQKVAARSDVRNARFEAGAEVELKMLEAPLGEGRVALIAAGLDMRLAELTATTW